MGTGQGHGLSPGSQAAWTEPPSEGSGHCHLTVDLLQQATWQVYSILLVPTLPGSLPRWSVSQAVPL
jgi:hypothetical protein